MRKRLFPEMTRVLILLLVSICFEIPAGFAQSFERLRLGDSISEARIKEMKQASVRASSAFIGRSLPDFSATTSDGRPMNKATMKGGVYLFAFWQTDCSCFDAGKLHHLDPLMKAQPDFHALSLLPDTAYKYLYHRVHPEPFPYAVVSSYAKWQELLLHPGTPSLLLVNRAGIIVRKITTMEMRELDTPEGWAALTATIEGVLKN